MTDPEDTPEECPASDPAGPDAERSAPSSAASERHAAVRRANQSEMAEDYVEAIDDLIRDGQEARVRDLATCFGVSHVTVSRTVERLMRAGLVITEPYRSIELTDAGREMAARSRLRHAAVLRFLLALGLPADVATEDSEGIEHHVGESTLAAFQRYADAHPPKAASAPASLDELRSAATDPERFARVRAAHASELTEDYVEAIADLIEAKATARVVDLAERFGVSHVTVSRTIGRLKRDGYVDTAPYRPIALTPEGQALAEASRERHGIVLRFLLFLGVDPHAAEIDAEGVEHHVSPATLERFRLLADAN